MPLLLTTCPSCKPLRPPQHLDHAVDGRVGSERVLRSFRVSHAFRVEVRSWYEATGHRFNCLASYLIQTSLSCYCLARTPTVVTEGTMFEIHIAEAVEMLPALVNGTVLTSNEQITRHFAHLLHHHGRPLILQSLGHCVVLLLRTSHCPQQFHARVRTFVDLLLYCFF